MKQWSNWHNDDFVNLELNQNNAVIKKWLNTFWCDGIYGTVYSCLLQGGLLQFTLL